MNGGALEKWDFYGDGTFLHEGVAGGIGAAVRSSGRGTYQLGNGWVELHIGPTTSAYTTGGSQNYALGAGSSGQTNIVKLSFSMRGKNGGEGIFIDNQFYKVRPW